MLKLTWLDDLFSDGDGETDTEGEPDPEQAEEWEPLDALPTSAEAQRTKEEQRETPIEQTLDDAHDPGAVQDGTQIRGQPSIVSLLLFSNLHLQK